MVWNQGFVFLIFILLSCTYNFLGFETMADLGDDDSPNQTPSQQSHTLISGDAGGPSWMVGGGSRGGNDGKQATQEQAPGGGDQPFMAVRDYHNPVVPPPPPPPPADPEQGNPMVCIMCGRLFSSDRSLSGHMKVHGGRDWRGSYPPPTFSIQEFYDDENAVAHLNPPSPDEGDGNGGVMEEEEENLSNEEENVIPDLNK